MANKFLDYSGLTTLVNGIKEGDVIAGHAATADKVPASGIEGVIPLANIPKGAQERLVIVTDDAARFALTTEQVQNGDTVKVESTKKMYYIVDDTLLATEDGYEDYVTGTAAYAEEAGSVDYENVQGKPVAITDEEILALFD